MNNRKLFFLLGMLVITTVVVSACGTTAAPTVEPTAVPLTDVSVQMAWTHEYSSAPLYTAVNNGHFAEQGLNVNLIAGGFGENGYIEPIDQVLSAETDFGMASGPALVQARAEGKPV